MHLIKPGVIVKEKSLLGNEVVVKMKKNGLMTWKVIESFDNNDVIPKHNNLQYGLKKNIHAEITEKQHIHEDFSSLDVQRLEGES